MLGENDRLLTPEQAAEILQISKRTMYEWLRKGEIPHERIGDRLIRIREKDILSSNARVLFEQACRLAEDPETVNQAANFFEKAILINRHYALAYFELGRMLYGWGHHIRAVEPLKKAVELNPSFPANMNLGLNFSRLGRFSEAETAFRNAVDLVPNHAQANHELGCSIMMQSYHDSRRTLEAVNLFRRALKLNPEYELSAHFLGQTLVLRLRDFEGARQFADSIKESLPDTADHIRLLIALNEGT